MPRYPAIVGPPVSDPAQPVRDEEPVEDGALRSVAERAVRNYVEGQRENLRADLDNAAVVSLPVTPLRLRSVESMSWAAPRRVAVTATADGADGASWTLRYELSVVRRDRWYVRAIAIDPTSKEVIR